MFTPWDTLCFMPLSFDATSDALTRFSFSGSDPDEEHEVGIKRIHALLHPDCYWRLTGGLHFDSPESRLEVPIFKLGQDDDESGNGKDHREFAELKEEEFAFIHNSLAEQAARRRTTAGGLLRVIVDGNERGLIDPNQMNDVRFDVDERAELIEVRTEGAGGDILLAAHRLTFDEIGRDHKPSEFSVPLESGRRLSLIMSPLADAADGIARASIHVSYKEIASAKAAVPFLKDQRTRLLEFLALREWSAAALLRPAFAVMVLALSTAGVLYLILTSKQQPQTVAGGTDTKPETEALARLYTAKRRSVAFTSWRGSR
jgi:hypothetical protein